AEFTERWKIEILSKQKPSSQKAVTAHLRCHILPHLGKLRLDSFGVENQQAFITRIAEGGLSSKYVRNVLVTLSGMVSTAKKWGYICEAVDFDNLVLPERGLHGEARTFTAEHGKQIIAAAEMPWKLMFALAAYCGLRAGEIMGLRAEDIDLERKTLHVSQTV